MSQRAISLGVASLIIVALVITVGFGWYLGNALNTTGTGTTSSNLGRSNSSTMSSSSSSLPNFADIYAITNDSSNYFPNGYYSYALNFTSNYGEVEFTNLISGENISLAGVKFTYSIPPSTSTFVTTINGQVETEYESIDYICGSFFNVTMRQESAPSFLLNYCTPRGNAATVATTTSHSLTAGQNATVYYTYPIPWSMWEIYKNSTPTVGIYVSGNGSTVQSIELVVAK